MKKIWAVICVITVLLSLTACGNKAEEVQNNSKTDRQVQIVDNETGDISDVVSEGPESSKEEPDMLKIEIIAGNKTFAAALYDNAAARTFIDMLPLTLNMSELNGNEKYYYLDTGLPTNASRPSGIKKGDIMLYGNSCLVLFYESFSTSYSYTPIGHIDDPTGLAAALGSGNVQVTFRKG